MFETFKRFLDDLTGHEGGPVDEGADERLAVAALLYHVMVIDGRIGEDEENALRALLSARFGLAENETAELVRAAGEADSEAVDLYGFTSVLKQRLDIGERERIVGMMWRMVFADGDIHEFEDNLIWRVAELLGVSREARISLKRAARADDA